MIMKKIHLIIGIAFIIAGTSLFPGQGCADDAYVTDSFKVTLRTGPSTDNKIISMISSGQPVEVLESENGWSRVRLRDNNTDKEGWILSRYLMKRMPWRDEAQSLRSANAEMKEKLPAVSKELDDALRREKALITELKRKSSQYDKLKNDYESLKAGAASYIELREKATATQEALEKTEEKLQKLTEENRILISSKRNLWFLSGALVLLFGLIIGLAIGRKQTRHRSSLYS